MGSIDSKFHGAGREDIDVLCIDYRPFVLEILEPRKRSINLKKLEKEINKQNKGKIEVINLEVSSKKYVQDIKSAKPSKTYKALIETKDHITEKDLKSLIKLKGIINQRTPLRVVRRRADIIRKRNSQ